MQVRPADGADRPAIREIAAASFRSSYALSPAQVELILEAAFTDDALSERLADDAVVVRVAVDDGDVIGFSDVDLDADGGLRWLHVTPTARGQSAGTALVNKARDDLKERAVPFTARVLESASEGGEFLQRFGLIQSGSRAVEIGGDRFFELVYAAGEPTTEANEPSVTVPRASRWTATSGRSIETNPSQGPSPPSSRYSVALIASEPTGTSVRTAAIRP